MKAGEPLLVTALATVPVLAQSGHFVTGGGNAVRVSGPNVNGDLLISGKVAGLGGETFEVIASADAQATYACRTGGGEYANATNKQDTSTRRSTSARSTPTATRSTSSLGGL